MVTFLLIRSMNNAIVTVRYDLQGHTSPKSLDLTSEIFYGVPSVIIYYLATLLSFRVPDSVAAAEILRDGRQIVRKELARRRVEAAHGGPALPTPRQLLDELEYRPLAYLPASTEAKMAGWPEDDIRATLSKHVGDVLVLRKKY